MEVEMKIRGLMMDPSTNLPIVVLKDVNGGAVRTRPEAGGSYRFLQNLFATDRYSSVD